MRCKADLFNGRQLVQASNSPKFTFHGVHSSEPSTKFPGEPRQVRYLSPQVSAAGPRRRRGAATLDEVVLQRK